MIILQKYHLKSITFPFLTVLSVRAENFIYCFQKSNQAPPSIPPTGIPVQRKLSAWELAREKWYCWEWKGGGEKTKTFCLLGDKSHPTLPSEISVQAFLFWWGYCKYFVFAKYLCTTRKLSCWLSYFNSMSIWSRYLGIYVYECMCFKYIYIYKKYVQTCLSIRCGFILGTGSIYTRKSAINVETLHCFKHVALPIIYMCQ